MSNRRVWLGGVLVLGLGLTASCSSDIEKLSPLPSTGGGSATAASGTGGMVPVPDPTRGDPLTFPSECPQTCDEACGRLAQCNGQESEIYPTDKDECLVRCNLAESGPLWDDQSGHFKCCTAQQGCDLIQHCGGWLKHPAAVASCATLCSCIFASPVATLTDGLKPPTGYRFAPDLLILAPHSSAALTHIRGLTVFRAGAYPIVKLSEEADEDTARRLATFGRILPTFVDKEGRVSAATGRLFITLASQGLFDQVDALSRAYGKLAPVAYGERLYLIEVADPWKALALQAALNELPAVTAELDMIRDYQWRYEPDDPSFADQWHLKNTGQTGGAAGIDGRVSEAWDVTLGDAAVVIAVNDDGVDLNHPEFAGRLKTEQNYPADWEAQMKQGAFGSHGTSCAGVAAAGADNADKGAGVCPSCTILPRLLGTSVGGSFQVSDKDIADGFVELVDAGAWVVSNSWGPGNGNPIYADSNLPQPALSAVRKAAFDYAETKGRDGKGTVIVFASGNSNATMDTQSAYTTNVAVTAVNDLGFKSYYSSFGPAADIAAPSSGGLKGIVTTSFNGGETDAFGGTSSACPFIAGVFGLVLSANTELTAAQARTIVFASANKIDPVFGQYDAMGVSPFYGHGLVNAHRAVQLASDVCQLETIETCITPSDDCGSECGTKVSCDACRTAADCAADHVCQAVAGLGRTVCVGLKTEASCPTGTEEVNGHCLPLPATCGICTNDEACNGRDDNCNGDVDENGVCPDGRFCWPGGPACDAGEVCAGVKCIASCMDDADCAEGRKCKSLKDAYGEVTQQRGCVTSNASQCEVGCEVIASSLDDAGLQDFVACMQDGALPCSGVLGCTSKLPINGGGP